MVYRQSWLNVFFLFIAAGATNRVVAQTGALALSSGSGAPGASVTLNLTYQANGTLPAAMEWDLTYPSADLSPAAGTFYTIGTAASAASKSVICALISPGDIRCIVSGLDTTAIASGGIAAITFQIASTTDTSASVSLVNVAASDGNANLLPISGTSGTVTINQATLPVPTNLTCSPSSLTAPATATCSLTLNVAPGSNTGVVLSSSSSSAVVPPLVTVNSGSATANFTLTPSAVNSSTTATITATLNSNSKAFTTTLLPPGPVKVTVSPAAASLGGGQSQQLAATVTGGSGNTAVIWSLNPPLGAISASGLYTAPTSIISQQIVTATATSVADPTKSASSTVTLQVQTISPAQISLGLLQSQQFVAIMGGAVTQNVKWAISPAVGHIYSNGLYISPVSISSPVTVQLTATSLTNASQSVTGVISLLPSIVTPTNVTLGPSQYLQFEASFGGLKNPTASWQVEPALGSISPTTGLYVAPPEITSPQTVVVTATSLLNSSRTATSTITLVPLNIVPADTTLGALATQQFSVLGATGSVSWEVSPAGLGTISATGLYTAPASIPAPQVITVTSNGTTSDETASTVVTVLPSVVIPNAINLSPTQTQQFSLLDNNGNTVQAFWYLLPNYGSISSTGLYTAPANATTSHAVTVVASLTANLMAVGSAQITLFPSAPQLLSFQCSPLIAGTSDSSCTIILSAPVQSNSVDVSILASPAAVTAPSSVAIGRGASGGTFPITLLTPSATLTATLGTSIEATVNPAAQ